MKLCLIGNGAIAQHVAQGIARHGHSIGAYLLRPERVAEIGADKKTGIVFHSDVAAMPDDIDLVVDCAGHTALRQYGGDVLRSGRDLVTVSIGALANQELAHNLEVAALAGASRLHLASGAIGALDTLRAARTGTLGRVRYIGRKPPVGWMGSPAQETLDLENMGDEAQTHFNGTARQAALDYPKNANVAAAVALSGLGFDRTEVTLIADPTISENIHEIHATGDFGHFEFSISGKSLADNPRSSALAAMSVVSLIAAQTQPIVF